MPSDVKNFYNNNDISGQVVISNALCNVSVVSNILVAMGLTHEEREISEVRCCLDGQAMGYTFRIIQAYTFLETLRSAFPPTSSSKTSGHSVGLWPALSGGDETLKDFFQWKSACFYLCVCVGVDYVFAILISPPFLNYYTSVGTNDVVILLCALPF